MAVLMEEDDHDELLQGTDDESLSETEDQCLPIDKPEENYRHTLTYFTHTKLEFLTTKLTLIFSTTVMLILLPLYLEAINVRGNAYSMILTNTSISTLLFIVTMVIAKCFCEKYRNIRICSFPVTFSRLIQLSGVYFICAFMIVYALDRKRVLCHLQDPIKGIVLVFSLLYYFFFCRKLMGLQRIFSATTIIVGLFIAVDYGLCDEFRCRGFERDKVSDDTGPWTWQTHAVWTTVYVAGLALFAAYFTLLDRYILTNNEMEFHNINIPSTFLSTVSRSVSFPNSNIAPTQFIGSASPDTSHLTKKHSVVHLAMWIHIVGLFIICLLFWTDFIPSIGKGSNAADFWNHTINGLICHFQKPVPPNLGQSPCGNVFLFSWIFMCSYVLFVVMSIKFLILSQSAVYTIASMSTSLPLVGIWWSLFHTAPHTNGDVLTAVPEENVEDIPDNRLALYQRLQKMTQHFWKRWTNEYITTLQNRTKWKTEAAHSIQPNAMVILKDDNTAPLQWKLGRVVELHPGSDKVTRVVTVKTANGVVKRAVHKICVLPLDS